MTHLEKISTSPKPTIIGYIGAATFGFIMQLAFHSIMINQFIFAISVILLYSLSIAILEFYCKRKNCKLGCEFNEFWFTLESIIKKKLNVE